MLIPYEVITCNVNLLDHINSAKSISETMCRLIIFFSLSFLTDSLLAQELSRPDTVTIMSDQFELKALLWHPTAGSNWPAIVFCHGSLETNDTSHDLPKEISLLGSLFAKRGYLFLGLFRGGRPIKKPGIPPILWRGHSRAKDRQNATKYRSINSNRLTQGISFQRFHLCAEERMLTQTVLA